MTTEKKSVVNEVILATFPYPPPESQEFTIKKQINAQNILWQSTKPSFTSTSSIPNAPKYALGTISGRNESIRWQPIALYNFQTTAMNNSSSTTLPVQQKHKLETEAGSNHAKFLSLGETFGNKRRKAQLKADERNRVDSSTVFSNTLNSDPSSLIDQIAQSSNNDQPIEQGVTEEVYDENWELLPKRNVKAGEAKEIYYVERNQQLMFLEKYETAEAGGPIDLEACFDNWERRLEHLETSNNDQEETQGAWWPYMHSKFINEQLQKLKEAEDDDGRWETLRKLYDLSCLFCFLHHSNANIGQIIRLKPLFKRREWRLLPRRVINRMLERFTETSVDATERTDSDCYRKTKTGQDRLITYMLIICLSFDFQVLVQPLASDFKLPTTKLMDYLRIVGCQFINLKKEEASRLLLQSAANTPAENLFMKKAVLRAPLSEAPINTFRGGKNRRRR